MTSPHPPRLAVALLRRFLPDNEPLAGDLLEGFAARQSRLWFWRQVLLAIAIRLFQHRDEEHPLGLAGHDAFVAAERSRNIDRSRPINLTASPVPGIGGLGLFIMCLLAVLVRPGVWWMLVVGILGGVLIAVTMVVIRRRAVLSRDASASPTLLGHSDDAHPAR